MMWIYVTVFLLWTRPGGCAEKANKSNLHEYTDSDFYETLDTGNIMFIFFEHQVSATNPRFLEELEKSADALQDYGVLVGKVNCHKKPIRTYCTDSGLQQSAVLFRGGKEYLRFNLDTVFDVNSIVSEILFAMLREEVKYVHTDTDLMIMERGARGERDIVLGFVLSLGTQEHRSFMETAYAYGSKYQFILITGGPVLKYLGVESPHSSQVWFLHCRGHSGSSDRCLFTSMSKPLTTLNLHSFLQLMETPLVTHVYSDPSLVQPPANQQTPQVFLFSHPATADLDLNTATTLAWKLRGHALVMLVHRESSTVTSSLEYNVAYRLPEKSSEVKYLTLQNINEVLEVFVNQEKVEDKDDEEEEAADSDFLSVELEDEIALSVFVNEEQSLNTDYIIQITSDNFHDVVARSSLTVAVFYLDFDAVSMAFLSSFKKVAERLADSEVQMSTVDCGVWTHLCAAEAMNSPPIPFQPVTAFPTVLLLRPEEPAQVYSSMLDAEALYRFIVLSQQGTPLLLSTQEEITSFLQNVPVKLAGYNPERLLGLFKEKTQAGVSVFTKAAKSLRGKVLAGLLTDELAEKWAAEHAVDLPAVLVFPSWKTHTHPSTLSLSNSAEDLLSDINTALLHPMPELTVENLPSFLSLGKALLLLFVGEEEDNSGHRQNEMLVEEMKRVAELGWRKMERYLPSWIHLGRTPAGMSILGSYFGSMPTLPALVLTHLPSGSEIYQYPTNIPIAAPSVLQWLQRVEDGAEKPAGMLGDDSWPAAFEFLDFLKLMDMEEEEERNVKEDAVKQEPRESPFSGAHTPDHKPPIHTEL